MQTIQSLIEMMTKTLNMCCMKYISLNNFVKNLQFIFHKQIFKISQTEDQLDSGGGITDQVFDAEQQERQSWRFCNS